jgi:hypothetical protein
VVTFAAAYLLIDETARSQKFYLSLYAVIFAETLSLLFPAYLIQKGATRQKKFPYHLGQAAILGIYVIGVFSLVIVAQTPISFNLLLVFHLVLFLICAIFMGLSIIGSFAFSTMDAKVERQRRPFSTFRNEFALICDRMEIIELDGAKTLFKSFKNFNEEELEYATAESLPGSEDAEMEMNFNLQKIGDRIMYLEQVAGQPEASEESDQNYQVTLQEIKRELDKMRINLKRREQIIGQLR